MRTHDAADDPAASYFDDPVDHLEPGQEIEETQEQRERRIEREAFREAAIKQIAFVHAIFSFIHEASNEEELKTRVWVVSSAIQHAACDGKSDSAIADGLKITRANLSKHKLALQRQNLLPPNISQKSVKARNAYSQTRKLQLNGNK
jgi:hypothetical protein